MRILLLGGNGNISWWCAKYALRHNHDVTVLTRGITRRTRRDQHSNARYVYMDINNLFEFKNFLKISRFDIVCDFLSYSEDTFSPRIELLSNYVSRFVVISSTIIFERNNFMSKLNEESTLRNTGLNPYVDGKLMVEKHVNSNKEIQARTIIVRPSHTFDTNVPTPLGSNCFTEIRRVLDGGNLLIPGNGEKRWTLMHSEDFARAWIRLIEETNSFGQTFNVVHDNSVTWNEIATDVLSVLGISQNKIKYISEIAIEAIEIDKSKDLLNSNLGRNFSLHRQWDDEYDISKLKNQLPGWGCIRSFKDGFAQTFEWLMQNSARQRVNQELLNALHKLDRVA